MWLCSLLSFPLVPNYEFVTRPCQSAYRLKSFESLLQALDFWSLLFRRWDKASTKYRMRRCYKLLEVAIQWSPEHSLRWYGIPCRHGFPGLHKKVAEHSKEESWMPVLIGIMSVQIKSFLLSFLLVRDGLTGPISICWCLKSRSNKLDDKLYMWLHKMAFRYRDESKWIWITWASCINKKHWVQFSTAFTHSYLCFYPGTECCSQNSHHTRYGAKVDLYTTCLDAKCFLKYMLFHLMKEFWISD